MRTMRAILIVLFATVALVFALAMLTLTAAEAGHGKTAAKSKPSWKVERCTSRTSLTGTTPAAGPDRAARPATG